MRFAFVFSSSEECVRLINDLAGGFGLLGYLTYGADTNSVITLNLDPSPLTSAVKLILAIAILFTYPLQLVPVMEISESLIFSDTTSSDYFDLKRNLWRASIVLATASIAHFLPFFGLLTSLVGSLGSAMLAFILPAVFHMRTFYSTIPRWVIAKDGLLVVFGLLVLVAGSTISVIDLIRELKHGKDHH